MVNNKKNKQEETIKPQPFKYTGMNNLYRKTDDYKNFMSMIMAMYPNMPRDLAEMALGVYKSNPGDKFYKDMERKINNNESYSAKPPIPENTILENLVKIYPENHEF